MKKSFLLAALLPLLSANAFADAAAQKLADKAQQLQEAVVHSQDNPGARDQFMSKLFAILDKAHCERKGATVDCSKATNDAVEAAQGTLDDLTDAWKQELAQMNATKALAQKTAAQAQNLRGTINAQPASAQARFQQTLVAILVKAKCRMPDASSVDCSQATAAQLETASDGLDQLLRDVQQASKQAASTLALAQKIAAQAQNLRAMIGAQPASAQAQFQQSLAAILVNAKCRTAATSVDCSQSTADALATAQTNLLALGRAVDQANAQAAANQILAQKTAAQAQSMRPVIDSLKSASVSAQFKQSLIALLIKAKCTEQAASVDCSQAAADQLAALGAGLTQLAHDIGQASTQLAAAQAFAQKFFQDVQKLMPVINKVPSAAAQQQLQTRLTAILNLAHCTVSQGVDSCSGTPAGQLQARSGLDQLIIDAQVAVEPSPLDAPQGSQTASAKFLADAAAVYAQIDVREVAAASMNAFLSRITKVTADAACNGPAFTITTERQSYGGLPLPPQQVRRPADPCQKSTPALLLAGETALQQIERDYQAQVKLLVEGGLPKLYAARIQDLYDQVTQAKMLPLYSDPPNAWIKYFEHSSLPADKTAEMAADDYNALVQRLEKYLKQWREN